MDEYIQPHPDSAVLLTIDIQNDFILTGAPGETEGTAEVVPQVQRLVEGFGPRTL